MENAPCVLIDTGQPAPPPPPRTAGFGYRPPDVVGASLGSVLVEVSDLEE
jgi:hypothetical protein